jgi:hypothetical protein
MWASRGASLARDDRQMMLIARFASAIACIACGGGSVGLSKGKSPCQADA